MATVLIVAYLLIVLAMIVVILLQRSEGGGLGMGGGGGGFMTARGSANLLTRTTAILGTLFMATAIALTIVSQIDRSSTSILDRAVQSPDGSPASVLDALDAMGGGADDLSAPAPAQPAPAQDDLTAPAAPAGSDADLMVPEAPAQTDTPGN
ncbi:preprotein translocase subunit SecG [Pelagibacterium sediminicola]|uniref:preprotein translocase subunit SecG n=1 Tax=Pelagibacterium sediminicola TaxID=2248761 RepID=UPI000E30BF93|nr:preprotein translocase subunit SecG [Pelagibacterium sediminicola]